MTERDARADPNQSSGPQRLDKWLWFARVARTRTLAAGLVTDGHVRINRERCQRPAQPVRRGDVITIAVGPNIRILEVVEPGVRRGGAVEAQTLFKDLTPPKAPPEPSEAATARREEGAGRPTKKDRRAIDRLRSEDH